MRRTVLIVTIFLAVMFGIAFALNAADIDAGAPLNRDDPCLTRECD